MPTPAAITTHHEPDPSENPWVAGAPPKEDIRVVPFDATWSGEYESLREQVTTALGDTALAIDHVGSTAVEGLAAKPVIDVDLTVGDPADEDSYLPILERLGYVLTVREPSWHEHRCFRLEHPRANLHVFGPDCPETIRHLVFRDWLRTHPEDRVLYERAKRASTDGAETVVDYNRRKEPAIREIYDRVFRNAGLI